MKDGYLRNVTRIGLTAATEGKSDRAEAACLTSMPKINVGTLETKGMVCETSADSIKFIPPSCRKTTN